MFQKMRPSVDDKYETYFITKNEQRVFVDHHDCVMKIVDKNGVAFRYFLKTVDGFVVPCTETYFTQEKIRRIEDSSKYIEVSPLAAQYYGKHLETKSPMWLQKAEREAFNR